MRLLVVEDDLTLGPALQEYLQAQMYEVDLVDMGQAALNALAHEHYHLVLLDLNLPDMSGLDVLRLIRAEGQLVPVLVLTARDSLDSRVAGLDAGADDYVVKPFALDELAARVRAFKRRQEGFNQHILEFEALVMDTQNREVRVHQERLNLSVREFAILEMLMQRSAKVVTKRQIVDHLADNLESELSDNAIEVYIYRLRKQLEGTGVHIQTVRGFGYMLEKDHA
ncbi:MAG: response regulator transcription factor [Pelistega sp.]|nr:response regulator transcription factor [Pelistega sp.]